MAHDIPAGLAEAVARELEGRGRAGVNASAGAISAAYRRGDPSRGVIAGEGDALAYAVSRMPATYAAMGRILAEVAEAAPDFTPRRILDLGAGPGTAGFAALDAWPEAASLSQVDHNPHFLSLAARLRGAVDAAACLEQTAAELPAWSGIEASADLTLLGYVLAELASDAAARVVDAAWAATAGVLVVAEPGTPDGWRRILAARDRLLAAGAKILAPCPHAHACPLSAPDWCHFAERLSRRRDHRLAKGATLPFEDEKFAYVAAARPGVVAEASRPRILARPISGKAGIELKLCRLDGTAAWESIARRDKARHALARRADWGDALDERL